MYLNMVRYKPKNQNIGIAINIDTKTALKLKSLSKNEYSISGFIDSQYSDLNVNASQVQNIHKNMSNIIAIALFKYLSKEKIFFKILLI